MTFNQGPLSMQLWSTRGDDPLGDQLAVLAGLGYTDVQPYHDQYDDVPALKDALAMHGFSSVSGHFKIAMFDGDAAPVISAAHALDMKLVVAPWLDPEDRPTDAEGWRAIHKRLQAMKQVVEGAGLRFAWHNHDFEFERLPDGSYGIEYLLDEDIDFAADLAWIAVGGEDPVKWLHRYAGRIPSVHIKDVAPQGTKEDELGFADVGQGTMPWPEIWRVLNTLEIPLRVAEHDQPSDWRRFAGTSMEALKRLRAA